MDMSNVNISRKKLGGGAFGNVFKGTMMRNKSQIDIAVKKIPNDGEYFEENARKENEVFRCMGIHENIIEMIGFSCDVHFMYIVMEFADLGDLSQYLEKKIPELNDKMKIMLQCSCAVKYMHNLRPKVIHRDIKPANILLKSSPHGYVVKMADFGLSRIFDMDASKQYMSTNTGTVMYQAPEQFTRGRKQYTPSVDVFSLGLVYMLLLNYSENHRTLEPLPASLQNGDLLPYAEYLREAKRNNKPMPVLFTQDCQDTRIIAEIKALVTQMTCFSADDRISIAQVEVKLRSLLPASGENVDSSNTQLREEICELQSQLSDISAVVQKNNDTIHRLQGDNRKQLDTIQRKDEDIHRLQGNYRKQRDTILRKDETIRGQHVTIQSKAENLQEQQEMIQRKDEAIQMKDARIRGLEAQLGQSTSKATGSNTQLREEICELQSQLSDISALMQKNDETIQRLQGDNLKQRDTIQRKDEDIHRLQADNCKQLDTILRKDETIQGQHETIQSKAENLQEQQEMIQRKDEAIQMKDARIRGLEAQLGQSTSKATGCNTTLHEEIRELQSQLRAVSVVVQDNDETIHRLQGDIHKRCDTIQRKDEDIQTKDAIIRELEDQLGQSTSQATGRNHVGKPAPINIGSVKSRSPTVTAFRKVPHLQRVSGQKPTLWKSTKLENKSLRMCCYQSYLYFPAHERNCIDVYTLDCEFIESIPLVSIKHPRSLHPLSSGGMVLASYNGLYIIDGEGKKKARIQGGDFYDVHVDGDMMVAIQKRVKTDSGHSGHSDCVWVLNATAPHTQMARFTLRHTQARTVLLHQDTVYVSDTVDHCVSAYNLAGQWLSQWGEEGRWQPGKLSTPRLCATDSSGQVLVADCGNNSLQLLTAGGEWLVLPGVNVESPSDVIIMNDRMWVLHGGNGDKLATYTI